MNDLQSPAEPAGGGADQPGIAGPAPIGMPEAQVQTCNEVRDMLYLAAHDSAFAGLTGERLTQMLTYHVARGQVIILRRGDWPVAFGMWGKLSSANLRTLMQKGYGALQPDDLTSGDKVVLLGVCSPWRREDFDHVFGACAGRMDDGSGEGGWYMILPAVNGMPKRLTRFRRTSDNNGVLEEARL